MSDLTRRDVLKLGAAGVAGAAGGLGFPAVVRGQAKEVVMLGIWPFTGAFADVGPILDRGMKMALEERGMKIQGKPIKYVTRDSETKAGSATRRVEEAVDGEGAHFVIGPGPLASPWPSPRSPSGRMCSTTSAAAPRTSRGHAAIATLSSGRRARTRPPRPT